MVWGLGLWGSGIKARGFGSKHLQGGLLSSRCRAVGLSIGRRG